MASWLTPAETKRYIESRTRSTYYEPGESELVLFTTPPTSPRRMVMIKRFKVNRMPISQSCIAVWEASSGLTRSNHRSPKAEVFVVWAMIELAQA